jgi:hypothetical protein
MNAERVSTFCLPDAGENGSALESKITKLKSETKALSQGSMPIMNKAMFEEKWKMIRSLSTARWSLLADHDLAKVDKADDKYTKYVTMLQVKYGYSRQEAREEIKKLWMKYQTQEGIA